MEQIYYGEDRVVEMVQEQDLGMLFYVSHNTPEMFNDYIEYCTEHHLDPTEEESAHAFLDYIDKLIGENG